MTRLKTRKKNTSRRKTLQMTALLLALAILMGGAFAWRDTNQHKTNEFAGGGARYELRLIEEFQEVDDWDVGQPPIDKKVRVHNVGDPLRGYKEAYARIQIKEYMEISSITEIETPHRYMINPETGRFYTYPSRGAAMAEWPEHEVSATSLTDSVTGDSGFMVRTQAGDKHGQYGKRVVIGYTAGTAVSVMPGVTRAVNPDHQVHPNGECDYSVHDFLDPLSTEAIHEYVKWHLNGADYEDRVEILSEWDEDDLEPGEYWLVDDVTGEGWVYWMQAIPAKDQTADFMKAVSLIQLPDGAFYYAVHVEMEGLSFDELEGSGWHSAVVGVLAGNQGPQPGYVGENRIGWQYVGTEDTYGLYSSSLPCVGKPKILVFVVDFLNDPRTGVPWWNLSVSDIEKNFFDLSRINDPVEIPFGHPVDYYSLRDFYYRSSYGKLDITGDVVAYTSQKIRSEYTNAYEIIDEVMEIAGAEDALDWSQYDSNGTGHADGVYIALRNQTPFPSSIFVTQPVLKHLRAGIRISRVAFLHGVGIQSDVFGAAHETCHMLGLPDVYAGAFLNPNGTGANITMDGSLGDLPGIMKYIYNWIEPMHIDTVGETRVALASISKTPQCVVIHPRGDKDNLHWFVVEYITRVNNDFRSPVRLTTGGLRIWRSSMVPVFFTGDFFNYNSPYEYIESVHHPGVRNHFFYPGDSFTPFTALNSYYPLDFQNHSSTRSRTVTAWADSGIYLENIAIEDREACFTVAIRED